MSDNYSIAGLHEILISHSVLHYVPIQELGFLNNTFSIVKFCFCLNNDDLFKSQDYSIEKKGFKIY